MFIQNDQNFQEYMRDISQYPRIDSKREQELAKIIQSNNDEVIVKAARDEFILANLRLVIKYALSLYESVANVSDVKLSLMDLISEGNLALMRAVDLFDPKHDAKFSTYATLGIVRRMRRAIQNSRFIKIPTYHGQHIAKFLELKKTHGKDITDKMLLEQMNITPYLLKVIKNEIEHGLANFVQIDDLVDVLPADNEDAIELMINNERKELVLQIIKTMPIKYQEVLLFKFWGKTYITLEKLVSKYGLTRQAIECRTHTALGKLKQKIREKIAIEQLKEKKR